MGKALPFKRTTRRPAPRTATPDLPAVAIATLVGLDGAGRPCVDYPDNPTATPVVALSNVALSAADIGRRCTLAFENGQPERPVILGLLQSPEASAPLTIRSDRGLVLESGEARIEISPDGGIRVHGLYIDSLAYGPHRIRGGSIKLN